MIIETGPYFLGIGISVVYTLIFFPFSFLFIYYRREEAISSRGWILSLLQSIAGYICSFVFILDGYYIGCFVYTVAALQYLPLATYPFFYRSFVLWAQNKYNESLLKQYHESKESFDQNISSLKRYSWSFKTSYQVVIFVVTFIICFIIACLVYFLDSRLHSQEVRLSPHLLNSRCSSKNQVYIFSAEYLITLVGIIISVIANWKVNDNLLFKFELKAVLIEGVIFFILALMSRFLNFPLYFRGSISAVLTSMAFFSTTIIVPVVVVANRRRMTNKEKLLEPVNVIDQILSDPENSSSFEKFVSEMWCTENLFFYKHVKEFEKIEDFLERKLEAQKIWKTYFEEGSALEINIDEIQRQEVREQLYSGQITTDLFEEPKRTILNMLQFSVYPLWREKTGYKIRLGASSNDVFKTDVLTIA